MSLATDMSTITITPASPAVGAEIGGVDIAAGVSDEQFAEIRQAYADYGVIFFREQNLTPEQHIEWAERWSEINVNRFFTPVEGHPRIAEVRKEPDQQLNIGTNWHTDHSYDQIPAMGSILLAREVPETGGDTLFSSQYAAFDALSAGMKQVLLTMRAEHTSRIAFGGMKQGSEAVQGRIGNAEEALQDSVHPVVIKHPLSGRSALYVNHDFTTNFEGWTNDESEPLLRFLWKHAADPVFTCRFSWKPGSMAIWDNRAVQHRALNDYQGQRRLMHRITLEGQAIGPATELNCSAHPTQGVVLTETTVVHNQDDEFDVYIGREVPDFGLPASKWGNPFILEDDSDAERDRSIAAYREWVVEQPELMNSLGELRGMRLGCWCAPKGCHGDVLAELADEGA